MACHYCNQRHDDDNGWMPLRFGSLDEFGVAGGDPGVLVP
jgi:hypothetical protein